MLSSREPLEVGRGQKMTIKVLLERLLFSRVQRILGLTVECEKLTSSYLGKGPVEGY